MKTLRAHLADSGKLDIGWLSLPEPLIGEICIRAGFEAMLVDLQHGLIDMSAALRMIGAIKAAGGFVLSRVPVGEFQTASRLLDWGADGVIAPMINSAEEAAAFASFMKYPLLGQRSWGPTRAMQLTGLGPDAYRRSANEGTLVMIETRSALDNLEAILAVPGIDGVFLGPFDLSIALSPKGEPDIDRADVLEAIEHVARATAAAGKVSGIYGTSAAHVKRYRAMGYSFATLSSDTAILSSGVASLLAAVASD
ncbi:HpcH/HpaI aldolase family protein [Oryzibacter oryziterrae]|uniref:HpcH/HpaI aldolase family protein n=1 Tax=Oryzibacter oryziterrae TaxID=2766474 RepID=UPI001F0064BB|nr:aldolase/citrate lyase family protein [Oryzibacter oryziterrae]